MARMVVPGPLCEPGGVDSADGHHQQRRRRATLQGAVAASTPTTTGGDGRPVAAAAVLGLGVALAVTAIGLWWWNTPDWSEDQWYFLVDLTDALVYGVVAWAVLARRSHPVGWILALTAVGGGLAAVSFQWTVRLAADPDLPALVPLPSAQQWGWVPGTLALVTVVPWLVRDTPLGRWSRAGVAAGAALTASMVVARATDPYPWPDGEPVTPFPVRRQWWLDLIEGTFRWQMGALVALGLVTAAAVAVRWDRDREANRGLGWLAIGATLLTLAFLPLAVTDEVAQVLPVWCTPVLHLASQLFFPGAVLVAVLRQRLWGLDLVVSRALVWSLLSAGVVGAYVALVAALGSLLSGDGVPQVVAAAFVAAGFQPARSWVQRRVDHLVRGHDATPLGVVRQVGSRLGSAGTEDLLSAVVASVSASLRLGSATIEAPAGLGGAGGAVRAGTVLAQVGDTAHGPTTGVPLVVRQALVGRLVVTARPGERLDARTLAALDDLAPVVAATVHLAATTDALTRSRRRLVEARDEERRALRRELHDGLGPALAGIGLGLQAARNQLATDPETAADLLQRLTESLEQRVDEVRGLARGLLPPALGDRGLGPALAELAERYAVTGLRVDLVLGDTLAGDVPPVAATAAYAIVSEAVRNVHRHARTDACTVTVGVDDAADELAIVVEDGGAGVDPAAPHGVGLISMRERAEGLAGSFVVGPAPGGGTRLEARLPLAVELGAAS